MHPITADLTARLVVEDRHRHAEAQRRLRAHASVLPVRARLGALLTRAGARLQRPAGKPTATVPGPHAAGC